ncbi:MAG TPA: hypothetical protein VGC41_02415, partial [Kofleriaceae bacterium]
SQGGKLDSIIVGIGVNLEVLPDIAHAARLGADREAFIGELIAQLESWVDRYITCGVESIVPAWQSRMAPGLTARAVIDNTAQTGTLSGIDRDGALLIDVAGVIHRVRSGDVEVIRPSAVLSPTA